MKGQKRKDKKRKTWIEEAPCICNCYTSNLTCSRLLKAPTESMKHGGGKNLMMSL